MGKIKKIMSTQNFSPIRDVERGIVITTDGRFIKILEFSPVNFDLRSPEEQGNIISQFYAVLRTMPKTIQFKVVTKRADPSAYIESLMQNMKVEKSENCRRLQREQINLISSVSASMGTSRHFYVIFEYEAPIGIKKAETFPEIVDTLNRQGRAIALALKSCGNEVISIDNDNDWTCATLFSIMCRSKSDHVSYAERVASVVSNYVTDNAIAIQDAPMLPINNFISPSFIDPGRSPKYLVIDDVYYSFCVIRGESYPTRAAGGWTQLLIGLGEGIDLDMWVHKENPETIQRKIQFKLRANNVKMKHTEDTSSDFDDLQAAIQAGYYLKSGLAGADEFTYFGAMLTITADSLEDLERRLVEVKNICIRADLKLRPCTFQQLTAFKMSLPICKYDPSIWERAKRNVLLSQFASAYPFTSFEMSDSNGLLLGTSVQNGTLVFIDPFDTSKYTCANMVIFGTSGGGKTYTLQCLALRKRMKQEQVYIIAPMKGEEFERACRAIGGEFIRLAPGSGQNINIMEIRKRDMSFRLEGEAFGNESILAQKIQQLHTFFALLIPDISQEEKDSLDKALLNTYRSFGITTNNKSLEDPLNRGHYRKMPVLGDLQEQLAKLGERGADRMHNILNRFVTGSASSFNKATNVNLDNPYIVIDVSHLSAELLPVGMFIATDYVWDKARQNKTRRKTIIIDEVWRLIGGFASAATAEFVLEIFKVIRGYGGSAVAATQDLSDVLSLNGGHFGSAILNNTRIKMLLRIESQNEAEAVARAIELTSKEVETIRMMERGTALLLANSNHVFVNVRASRTEHDLITTDRNDLQRLAMQQGQV